IVIGTNLYGFLEVGDSFVDHCAVLCGVLAAQRCGKRIGISHLLLDIVLVVVGAQFAIGAERQGPVNDADPVVGLGIIGAQLDMFLVEGLGLFELLGIVRLAGHLENDRAGAVDGAHVLGIDVENFLELVDGLGAEAGVLLGQRAGNVLAGVSRGQ